jgi:hypothetical protein
MATLRSRGAIPRKRPRLGERQEPFTPIPQVGVQRCIIAGRTLAGSYPGSQEVTVVAAERHAEQIVESVAFKSRFQRIFVQSSLPHIECCLLWRPGQG